MGFKYKYLTKHKSKQEGNNYVISDNRKDS